MQWRNSESRYGLVSKLLHWVLAALIVFLIWLGWYLVGLSYYDRWFTTAMHWHRALGVAVLMLAVVMNVWRLCSRAPRLSSRLRPWERATARLAHGLLLILMLAIPTTGYLISTSQGEAVPLFADVAVPAIAELTPALRDAVIEAHFYLAYGCGLLVLVHAGAGLKHHFIDKDDTLRKML